MSTRPVVLLSGATGFVGRHLYPALVSAGCTVISGSRTPAEAAAEDPDQKWVELDFDRPSTVRAALEGCTAAYVLVHEIGEPGYEQSEIDAAVNFRAAAEDAKLDRVVYLGGVAPKGEASTHLRTRLEVGEALRSATVPVTELRASMIIGDGSASWQIVRDLAARLPAFVLPKWMENRSAPVFIDDVVAALVAALLDPRLRSGWFDLTGPDLVSHREILEKTAEQIGGEPIVVESPIESVEFAQFWVDLVSDVDPLIANELLEGLQADLTPSGDTVWYFIDDWERTRIDAAIANALSDEKDAGSPCAERRKRLVTVGEKWRIG